MSVMTQAAQADRDVQEQPADATPPARSEPESPAEMSPERRERVEKAQAFAREAAKLCADLKCRDVVVLDVAGLSPVCDVLVLATGSSPRQMRTIGVRVEELAGEHDLESIIGFKRSEANEAWIALDLVDVVVHVFEENARSFYDLDGLWGDAREIKWYEGRESASEASR